MLLRTIAVYLSAPWTTTPVRVAALFRQFAVTELGSAFTMRWAAAQVEDVELQAKFLRHAIDEERHARLFHARAAELDASGATPLHADAEDLLGSLGLMKFLLFVARAEGRGRRQFQVRERRIRNAGDAVSADLLAEIISDEKHHEAYSLALLEQRFADRGHSPTFAIVIWEHWSTARRFARAALLPLVNLIVMAAYCMAAPLSLLLGLLLGRSVRSPAPDNPQSKRPRVG